MPKDKAMDTVLIQPPGSIGHNFIPPEYLPDGADEYYLRNEQTASSQRQWRHLNAAEVERLVQNRNTSDSWDTILVTDEFDPVQIMNNQFFGLVRIGRLRNVVLEHHELRLPCGITDSRIAACDIGDDVAIHSVRYLAHYIVGNRCILTNIDEMHTTNHAKFGNGILKDGEPEAVRVWLDVMNEASRRKIMAFEGMVSADAYLWAKYRDDPALQEQLKGMTQNQFDCRRGYYGSIGDQTIIKNCQILKDVKVGDHCYIKGANKLKNMTIQSSAQQPTQIGEGVELVNGIIGFGCHIFYGVKAVRFVLGQNSSLKYGARLINSFLGDNSTISCCEVLNNLIFPAHEQHHNNSFLIASVILGQSNMAAGATIGSNHNSRSNDNELQAGRGFWPGLCTSIKHPCRFASFVLLSKGDYPAEMNIPLPFSLLNNNPAKDRLEIVPAFWWLHNMYALARNSWKFVNRDKRPDKTQHVEFDPLAPDTVEEIITARGLLELWCGRVLSRQTRPSRLCEETEIAALGRQKLTAGDPALDHLEIIAEDVEKSRRKTVILKIRQAWKAYGQMILYYSIKNLTEYLQYNHRLNFDAMRRALGGPRQRDWTNLGGQLIPTEQVDQLRKDIGCAALNSWQAVHQRYDELWGAYPLQKQRHAFACLCDLLGTEELTCEQWCDALHQAVEIQEYIRDQVYLTRKKDFDNPFLRAIYRNQDEMNAILGTAEDNDFVRDLRQKTEQFKQNVSDILHRR